MYYIRLLAALAVTSYCLATPIGVNGFRGPEWTGVIPTSVAYNPAAPSSNFGAPTNQSDAIGYDIYLRADSSFVYGLIESRPDLGGTAVGNFANLYFDTDPSMANGSDLGFEVNNLNAFIPGDPGSFNVTPYLTFATGSSPLTTEFALPISFLTSDPMSMGFPLATEGRIVLRLSQSFGYSVAGGSSYGVNRLGSIPFEQSSVPEPATLPLVALGAAALLGFRRFRK